MSSDDLCDVSLLSLPYFFFFFFNDTATTEIYTLSLHDALPILAADVPAAATSNASRCMAPAVTRLTCSRARSWNTRSEEHTSELQSLAYLVCRLLLEKKKNKTTADSLRRAKCM